MDQVALKSIEDAVFQFDIKRYIDNTTKQMRRLTRNT